MPLLKLTPTQKRLLKMLSDGQRHTSKELIAQCLTEDGTIGALRLHISQLRRKIQPHDQTVICEMVDKKGYYRLISFPKPAPQIPLGG